MAGEAHIIFGALLFLIGVGMVIGAVVWHGRSVPMAWTGGMILLLVLGIILGILGIVWAIFGGIRYTRAPTGYRMARTSPRLPTNIVVQDPLNNNAPITVGQLIGKCQNMDVVQLAEAIQDEPIYRTHCSGVLGTRKMELLAALSPED